MELLAQEYFKLMDVIGQYDDLIMMIKGWSITVGMALVGFAFQQGRRSILLLCCVSSVSFAFVDAKFKEYQTRYYPRMHSIEQCMSHPKDKSLNCNPLQINRSWESNKQWYGVFMQFGKLGVLMPHFILFILALWLFLRPNNLLRHSPLTKQSSRLPKAPVG